ncbi:hypothetical protein Tco_0097312 [Tanacetum coccineum]
MSNTNNNFLTQTSSVLHNAIMEAGGKDQPPMLSNEEIKKKMDAEAEAIQIILTGIDNDIYSAIDSCPNDMEIIAENEVNDIRSERLASTANPLALVAQQQPVYQPQHDPTHYSQSSSTRSQAATRNRGTGYDRHTRQYDNQRVVNVVGARECKKPKRLRDLAYHKQKMLLCKQKEAGFQLIAEQANWRDDSDDEPKNHELEAHYLFMAKVQEAIPEDADNSGPIFDIAPLEKVHTTDDHYNVFSNERQHPKQPESINDTYLVEQDDNNISPDSSNMCSDKGDADQDDIDQERQSVQTMIMLNRNCKMSFAKPQYLKKAQSVIPRLYDIRCYNDNLALKLAPESDETFRDA